METNASCFLKQKISERLLCCFFCIIDGFSLARQSSRVSLNEFDATLISNVLRRSGQFSSPRVADDFPSVARYWDEEVLAAIRIDLPNPPVHARNLFHLSAAMYDAWAAYDPVAVGYTYHEKHQAADIAGARRQAISYAAYRVLTNRYVLSRNAAQTLPLLASRFAALGYDPQDLSEDPTSATGVGNRQAAALLAFAASDGSLQERGYAHLPSTQGGYASRNPPLLTLGSGTLAIDPNRWQPLAFTNAVSQNDIPVDLIQKFLGSQWLGVRPFALTRTDSTLPWIDPWTAAATRHRFGCRVSTPGAPGHSAEQRIRSGRWRHDGYFAGRIRK